jgi:hypothetical protein
LHWKHGTEGDGVIKGLAGRVRRWFDRSARHEDVRYRTPHEIALQNAADALGVTLGEDYLDADYDFPGELIAGIAGSGSPDRLDASREELLVYIERARSKRRRRMRQRRLALTFVAVAAAIVLVQLERHEASSPGGRADSRKSAYDAWSKLPPVARSPMGIPEPVARGVSTEMPAGAGRMILAIFRDVRGDICSTITDLVRGVLKGKSGGGCIPPSELSLDLATAPASYYMLSAGNRYVVLTGYGRPDLERIVSRGPRRVDIKITPAWELDRSVPKRRFSFKAFMIRVWHREGYDWAIRRASDSRPLDLTAVFGNGQTIRVRSWDEMRRGVRGGRDEPPPSAS